MRRVGIPGIALLLAACGTAPRDAPDRFRAWCNTDHRYVGDWQDSREAAEKDREEHLKRWGWHAVRIDVG